MGAARLGVGAIAPTLTRLSTLIRFGDDNWAVEETGVFGSCIAVSVVGVALVVGPLADNRPAGYVATISGRWTAESGRAKRALGQWQAIPAGAKLTSIPPHESGKRIQIVGPDGETILKVSCDTDDCSKSFNLPGEPASTSRETGFVEAFNSLSKDSRRYKSAISRGPSGGDQPRLVDGVIRNGPAILLDGVFRNMPPGRYALSVRPLFNEKGRLPAPLLIELNWRQSKRDELFLSLPDGLYVIDASSSEFPAGQLQAWVLLVEPVNHEAHARVVDLARERSAGWGTPDSNGAAAFLRALLHALTAPANR